MSRFTRVLREVKTATRKASVEIVNRAARDVAFRAASFTPKTTGAIVAATLSSKMLAGLASAALRKNGKFTKAEHKAYMKRILAKRKRGIGGIRAGWIPAIKALGGTYRGAKMNGGGSASKGKGKMATTSSLVAFITNAIITTSAKGVQTGGGNIPFAKAALEKAIRFVTSDREAYLRKKKLAEAMKQASR